jgi:hypothetical protein
MATKMFLIDDSSDESSDDDIILAALIAKKRAIDNRRYSNPRQKYRKYNNHQFDDDLKRHF